MKVMKFDSDDLKMSDYDEGGALCSAIASSQHPLPIAMPIFAFLATE